MRKRKRIDFIFIFSHLFSSSRFQYSTTHHGFRCSFLPFNTCEYWTISIPLWIRLRIRRGIQVVSSGVSLKFARLRPLNTQLALRSTTFLFRLSKQIRGGIEVVSGGVSLEIACLRPLNTQVALRSTTFLFRLILHHISSMLFNSHTSPHIPLYVGQSYMFYISQPS
jgi:hypothetical protein